MKNYQYVPKKEWAPVRDELFKLIHLVQDEVREYFTFKYEVIGSASRNMITREVGGNQGYDFDINLTVNDDENNYSPKQIRDILRKGFDKHSNKFSYDNAEDSTRVITIKVVDKKNSKVLHSCDFAVVNDYEDDDGYYRQQYIHFDKHAKKYLWENQPDSFYELYDKIDELKKNGLWEEVRKAYLIKKRNNNNPKKKSRSLFRETINEMYDKYGE